MAYNELIKETNIIRSMSRAGKPTDNPVNEALNGWIKEELMTDFGIGKEWRWSSITGKLDEYVKFYNEKRPCFAIGYDTSENYRKRYYKGELPPKNSFKKRVLSPEPKFVRERRKRLKMKKIRKSEYNESTFSKGFGRKTLKMSTLVNY